MQGNDLINQFKKESVQRSVNMASLSESKTSIYVQKTYFKFEKAFFLSNLKEQRHKLAN